MFLKYVSVGKNDKQEIASIDVRTAKFLPNFFNKLLRWLYGDRWNCAKQMMLIKIYTDAGIYGTMGFQEPQSNGAYIPSQGRLMYADYSPLEDDRNLIQIIKEFVGIAAKLKRLDAENKKLQSLFSDTDSLRDDILAAIKEIKESTTSTMEKFYDSHSNVFKSDTFKPVTSVLTETRDSLSGVIEGAQQSFLGQHAKYRDNIGTNIRK
jgi:hypothetical protein